MLVMNQELVTLKSRTGKQESFTYDGRIYDVEADKRKKGLTVPRIVAELAVNQNALRWDPSTGQVVESTLYVEEDIEKEDAMPSTPITQEEIQSVKETDGLGEDSLLVNGKLIKKTKINLRPTKENFAANNL